MMRVRSKFSGTTDPAESIREQQGRELSRIAAAEGMVVLENRGILPLKNRGNIALYGSGGRMTIKGGTGSGDVNERHSVSIEEGLENAGFLVTTKRWLDSFDAIYRQARADWQAEIEAKKAAGENPVKAFFGTPFRFPEGDMITEMDVFRSDAEIAIYVISRLSGEGRDRDTVKGDYYLYDSEYANLKLIAEQYEHTILVLNTGSLIDLGFLDEIQGIDAVIYMMQCGMEGGSALADLLTGAVTPSGRLTDSWPYHYEDYPSAASFSHLNGDVEKEYYTEGIYVGYRYFDTFHVPVRYPFGYGLSYTQFQIYAKTVSFMINEQATDVTNGLITVAAKVTNTGTEHAGKEVVQIYASCPAGKLKKEAKRLVGYGKSRLLAPGESQTLRISFPIYNLSSYDEESSSYLLEEGMYLLHAGNSSGNTETISGIMLDRTCKLAQHRTVCPQQGELVEIQPEQQEEGTPESGVPILHLSADLLNCEQTTYGRFEAPEDALKIAEQLSDEELAHAVCGIPKNGPASALGMAAVSVPGGAGETTRVLTEKYGLPGIVLADGPAGIRLRQCYHTLPDGSMDPADLGMSLAGRMGAAQPDPESTVHYQYCTAIPIGTVLAQTWNLDLIEEIGMLIGQEMAEFGVTLWLAPGMNIHRNPLCGRNFEYYSEDPLISGTIAAAMTKGVQRICGVGTTIKHFACNNQEENRKGVDSIVSERALREIYLKGFEIAVRSAQPMAIMSSYNLVNGVHSANSIDLCTRIARNEWGFGGLIMTDWTTTQSGGSSSPGCMTAGNDLIMPGTAEDIEQILNALCGDGEEQLERADLVTSAARVIHIVQNSSFYGEDTSYQDVYRGLPFFVKSHS